MGKKSPIRRVLEGLTEHQLNELLAHQGLSTKGDDLTRIARLCTHHNRDLGALMRGGPWQRPVWRNIAMKRFGCDNARSFDDIEAELLRAVVGDFLEFLAGNWIPDDEPVDGERRRESSTPGDENPRRTDSDDGSKERRGGRTDKLHPDERWVLELGSLSWPVTLDQVRAVRREFGMFFHPDRNAGRSNAEDKMKRLNNGCDLLEARLR